MRREPLNPFQRERRAAGPAGFRRRMDIAVRRAHSEMHMRRLPAMLVFAAIAALIVVLAVTHNFWAWGILGASLILLVIVLAILWYRDSEQIARFKDTEKRA